MKTERSGTVIFKSYTGLRALLKTQEKVISPKEKNKKPLGEFYLRHINKNKSQQNNTPNRQKTCQKQSHKFNGNFNLDVVI